MALTSLIIAIMDDILPPVYIGVALWSLIVLACLPSAVWLVVVSARDLLCVWVGWNFFFSRLCSIILLYCYTYTKLWYDNLLYRLFSVQELNCVHWPWQNHYNVCMCVSSSDHLLLISLHHSHYHHALWLLFYGTACVLPPPV